MEQLNTEQVKETKYLYENQTLKDLSEEEPDAILFWDGDEQALITKHADDLDNAYETAMDFFTYKLDRDFHGNLNEFAKMLGYGLGAKAFSMADFLVDWNNYSEDALREIIHDDFNGDYLEDIYND